MKPGLVLGFLVQRDGFRPTAGEIATYETLYPSGRTHFPFMRGRRWAGLRDVAGHYPPESPGCYVFLENGYPVYVGQTLDLKRRFVNHRSDRRLDGTEFRFRLCRRYGEWRAVEARLIRRFQPIHNKAKALSNGRLVLV